MTGVIGLIVLLVLLAINYTAFRSITQNVKNRKTRSLIITVSNFVLVMIYVVCLPLVGGYKYKDMSDVFRVLFSESTAPMFSLVILCFVVAMIYFSAGAWKLNRQLKIEEQIQAYKVELKHLENQLNSSKSASKLFLLIKLCGCDTSTLERNSKIESCAVIKDKISEHKVRIKELSQEINQNPNIH